jgi:hypothetical protein
VVTVLRQLPHLSELPLAVTIREVFGFLAY